MTIRPRRTGSCPQVTRGLTPYIGLNECIPKPRMITGHVCDLDVHPSSFGTIHRTARIGQRRNARVHAGAFTALILERHRPSADHEPNRNRVPAPFLVQSMRKTTPERREPWLTLLERRRSRQRCRYTEQVRGMTCAGARSRNTLTDYFRRDVVGASCCPRSGQGVMVWVAARAPAPTGLVREARGASDAGSVGLPCRAGAPTAPAHEGVHSSTRSFDSVSAPFADAPPSAFANRGQ